MSYKKKERGGFYVFLFLLALIVPAAISEAIENELVTAITVIYYIIIGIIIISVTEMWTVVIGILILFSVYIAYS